MQHLKIKRLFLQNVPAGQSNVRFFSKHKLFTPSLVVDRLGDIEVVWRDQAVAELFIASFFLLTRHAYNIRFRKNTTQFFLCIANKLAAYLGNKREMWDI